MISHRILKSFIKRFNQMSLVSFFLSFNYYVECFQLVRLFNLKCAIFASLKIGFSLFIQIQARFICKVYQNVQIEKFSGHTNYFIFSHSTACQSRKKLTQTYSYQYYFENCSQNLNCLKLIEIHFYIILWLL